MSDGAGAEVFKVAGPMTIYRAAELKPEMLAQLEQHAHVVFDLSDVSEFDTAGAQLLLIASMQALERRGTARVGARSQAVSLALGTLGLQGTFPDCSSGAWQSPVAL